MHDCLVRESKRLTSVKIQEPALMSFICFQFLKVSLESVHLIRWMTAGLLQKIGTGTDYKKALSEKAR